MRQYDILVRQYDAGCRRTIVKPAKYWWLHAGLPQSPREFSWLVRTLRGQPQPAPACKPSLGYKYQQAFRRRYRETVTVNPSLAFTLYFQKHKK